ncbi:hypothetical protein PIB30_019482 [Stylosanthes scabra]|uniref:PB1-like domain-containing protein n=1 Tax=Stylosanthes scabra TaxID=79078 RepID=A0ABU6T838_9FABA|nr:hypothetical protein [Stylosanthes scabra]
MFIGRFGLIGPSLQPQTTFPLKKTVHDVEAWEVVGVEGGEGEHNAVEASARLWLFGRVCDFTIRVSMGRSLGLDSMWWVLVGVSEKLRDHSIEISFWSDVEPRCNAFLRCPLLHHNGKLVRLGDGRRYYVDGAIKRCDSMDVDFINLKDLETLGKEVGYLKFEAMHRDAVWG